MAATAGVSSGIPNFELSEYFRQVMPDCTYLGAVSVIGDRIAIMPIRPDGVAMRTGHLPYEGKDLQEKLGNAYREMVAFANGAEVHEDVGAFCAGYMASHEIFTVHDGVDARGGSVGRVLSRRL